MRRWCDILIFGLGDQAGYRVLQNIVIKGLNEMNSDINVTPHLASPKFRRIVVNSLSVVVLSAQKIVLAYTCGRVVAARRVSKNLIL